MSETPVDGGEIDEAVAVGERLAALYRAVGERSMWDLPIYNPVLRVEAVGFRDDGKRIVGIIVTPWFMNLVVARRADGPDLPEATFGATVSYGLPNGEFPCVVGEIDGFGRLDSSSLFSPMFEFDDPEVAKAVAEAAIEEVFRLPEPAVEVVPETVEETAGRQDRERLDRRAFLFGRRAGEG